MNSFQKDLLSHISYCKNTGKIIGKIGCSGRKGSHGIVVRGRNKYIQVTVNGFKYYGHRLAWLVVYGEWPRLQVDHIDGDGLNNKIDNLRVASIRENGLNKKKQTNNSSGFNGVAFDSSKGKWKAQIMVNGKNINLGRFVDKCDAISARQNANKLHGFHDNHGR